MKNRKCLLYTLALVAVCGIMSAQKTKKPQKYPKMESPQPRFSYLTMNGEFEMSSKDSKTLNDRRNPSRITLHTSEKPGTPTKMIFFDH